MTLTTTLQELAKGNSTYKVVYLQGGPTTAPFPIGEGVSETEARLQAAETLRDMADILENGDAALKGGWIGAVSDGWIMSPLGQP